MDGILNILKPAGMTSFDVVAHLRGLLGIKKIGHAGTLDPMAVGVLPICTGRATRVIEFMMEDDKVYRAELTLGVATDTEDSSGNPISVRDVNCTDEQIIQVIQAFTGKYMQTPPMYSALKINGKRLYELAREGIHIERRKREVEIYSIEVICIDRAADVKVLMEVHCSKGTYIRTLCADIGERLGCGGHMSFLLRKRVGFFDIESAVTLERLAHAKEKGAINDVFSPVELLFSHIGRFKLDERTEKRFMNGMKVSVPTGEYEDMVRVYNTNNVFVALGSIFKKEDVTYLKVRKFI